jgi:hypothetical protein
MLGRIVHFDQDCGERAYSFSYWAEQQQLDPPQYPYSPIVKIVLPFAPGLVAVVYEDNLALA